MTVFLGGAGVTGFGLGFGVAVGLGEGFLVELLGLGVGLGVGVGLAVLDSAGVDEGVGPRGASVVGDGESSLKINPSPRS